MYAKLFSSMYDGTLGTVGPWEALVTFQQMLILADQDGVVDMTLAAIQKRTTIPLNVLEKGIKALAEPDPESRSPLHEGRRIHLLTDHRSWGWQIVNFKYYRQLQRGQDRREKNAGYAAAYRERQKEKKADVSTRQQKSARQPIAYAYADAEVKATPPTPSSKSNSGAMDELWQQFKAACAWTDPIASDFDNAWFEWRALDSFQKMAAIEGMKLLQESGQDPTKVKQAKRYLRDREWTRPVRKPLSKQPANNLQQLAEELDAGQ
jgi:hypothetical protein